MTATIKIPVENISEIMETYDEIEVYRDTTATGAFSTLVTTITFVAAQTLYTYEDANGTAASWYRHRFHNDTGPVNSIYSTPWQVTGLNLEELRIRVAEHEGVGFRGTADASSTTLLLIDADLGDSAVDSEFLEGAWIYRPDAASASDKVRRVSSYDTTNLGLIPTRAWGAAPSTDEAYHVFNLLPPVDTPGAPMSYDRAINWGLERVWYEDEITIGVGTTDGKTRFDVSAFLPYVNDLHEVALRRFDTTTAYPTDKNAGKNGGFWRLIPNGRNGMQLELVYPPGTDDTIIGKVFRHQDPLYNDADLTDCPPEVAVAAGAYGLFWMMTKLRPGSYTGELSTAESNFSYQMNKHNMPSSVVLL